MVRSVVNDVLVLQRTGRTGILVLLVWIVPRVKAQLPTEQQDSSHWVTPYFFTSRLTNTLVSNWPSPFMLH